jgi:sigma-B regulation protein RsbU (phosphoserine phosphatase)
MSELRRAVVIEDDPDIRGLLVSILTQQGFRVTAAAAGLPGIEAVRTGSPDLVTLDLNLPDVDGLEVCRRLREFSDAFIIMLTARNDELDKLTGLDNGADEYINKPFSPRELQSRINALFRRTRTPAADPAAQSELDRAAHVQQSLLPREEVQLTGYEIAGAFRPSRSVGGDFYDWYETPDGLHLTFADAMGKGIGAALIAATVRAVMRSVRYERDLGSAFEAASRSITSDLALSGSFTTMFHARLDSGSGKVSYVDAGHGLAVHITANGTAHRLPPAGPPVGAWADAEWPVADLVLAPGDSLVVVSDGVLDAFSTVEDFTEAVQQAASRHSGADEACAALMRLAPAETAQDDVTAVVIRRSAATQGSPGAAVPADIAASPLPLPPRRSSPHEMNSPTCLVIEDDQDIRDLLSTILTGMGFNVHAAATGTAALRAAETLDLALITLDLGLPDLNGLDVAHHLRSLSKAPILMITAWAESGDELNGVASGADAYLIKPFRPYQLRELVQRLCPPEQTTSDNDTATRSVPPRSRR